MKTLASYYHAVPLRFVLATVRYAERKETTIPRMLTRLTARSMIRWLVNSSYLICPGLRLSGNQHADLRTSGRVYGSTMRWVVFDPINWCRPIDQLIGENWATSEQGYAQKTETNGETATEARHSGRVSSRLHHGHAHIVVPWQALAANLYWPTGPTSQTMD